MLPTLPFAAESTLPWFLNGEAPFLPAPSSSLIGFAFLLIPRATTGPASLLTFSPIPSATITPTALVDMKTSRKYTSILLLSTDALNPTPLPSCGIGLVPQQPNGFDCGIYCCAIIDLNLQDLPLQLTLQMQQLLAFVLLLPSYMELLHFCSYLYYHRVFSLDSK